MKKSLLITVFLALSIAVYAQRFTLQNDASTCRVEGTSTLHDWHLDATKLTGKASIELDGNEIVQISELFFEVDVKGLESGKGAMDKNTFKALKSEDYPKIRYQFVRVISQEETTNGLLIKTGGKLSIAGATKSVYLDVLVSIDQSITFEGKTTFNMSDYGVEPPVALMGTITTGDEITIAFNVQYSK